MSRASSEQEPLPRGFGSFSRGALVCAALCGCGSEEASAEEPGGGVAEFMPGVAASQLPYQPCASEAEVGSFALILAEGYTRVDGAVQDTVDPYEISNEAGSAGSCRLLTPPVYACPVGCAASREVCGPAGECLRKPVARDLGTVRFRGLAVPHELEPNDTTKHYASPAQSLPHPGFAPGADIRAVTGGGDYPRFELRGWGVSPLVVQSSSVRIAAGMDVPLSWQAPVEAGPAHVHVELNINRHGSSSAWVECDFPDNGAGVIPGTLIDGLFERGTSGYPTLLLTRRTATSASIEPGCVELFVAAEAILSPDVDGVRSCSDAEDCEPGEMCRTLELFCE